MLENTYTTDDLVERLALMRTFYAKRLFSGGEDVRMEDLLQGVCEPQTITALLKWQDAFQKSDISPLVVYEALDTVEEDVSGLPSVTVYVPIHFAQEYVERFGKWFREKVQPNMLMTLRTDPRMGGGCGIVWNNVYYDCSIRYHMQQKREEVIAMFNQHMHA